MRCASASCSATAHSVLPDENCGIGLTSPARLVLAGGVSLRLDRSTRAPLLRFVSLQRSLANRALSGSAIFRTIPLRHWLASCDGGDRSCPRRNGRLPLRFFALRMRRSPETVFKHARSVAGHASRLSSRDVPLPGLFRNFRHLAGQVQYPAALMGFVPFAVLFLLAGEQMFPLLAPTCRFVNVLLDAFLSRDRPPISSHPH